MIVCSGLGRWGLLYLWCQVIHRQDRYIEADSSGRAALLIGHWQDKLDVLRERSNVQDGGHVSNLHVVNRMLQREDHVQLQVLLGK